VSDESHHGQHGQDDQKNSHFYSSEIVDHVDVLLLYDHCDFIYNESPFLKQFLSIVTTKNSSCNKSCFIYMFKLCFCSRLYESHTADGDLLTVNYRHTKLHLRRNQQIS
jgi:hypothetical protein